jgi:hypothetical protein
VLANAVDGQAPAVTHITLITQCLNEPTCNCDPSFSSGIKQNPSHPQSQRRRRRPDRTDVRLTASTLTD